MTNYFGRSDGGSGNLASPFYQLRPHINPYSTNTSDSGSVNKHLSRSELACWRAGVGNNVLSYTATTTLTLSSVSSTGVLTTIASTDYTSLLASANNNPKFTYSSVDQCFYFILTTSTPTFRLCKMSDTTGIITPIGSAFTPTTIGNWSTVGTTTSQGGQMYLDPVSGHIKYIYNGVYHLLNKSTGAIVSQDTAISFPTYSVNGYTYVTSDNTLVCNPIVLYDGSTGFTTLYKMVGYSGVLGQSTIPPTALGSTSHPTMVATIDHDKILIGAYPSTTGASTLSTTQWVVLREDYDKYWQSIYNYYTT